MKRAFAAGVIYFLAVFALGFAFGVVRTMVLASHMGEMRSVLIEIPVMLSASWIICGLVLRRMRVSAQMQARIVMGATALGLLMTAEWLFGLCVLNRTVEEIVASYRSAVGAIGLVAQVAFALFVFARRNEPPVKH